MKAILAHFPDLPWACLTQDAAAQWLSTFLRLIEGGTSGVCAPVGPHPVMDGVITTGAAPYESRLLTRHAVRADGFGTDLVSALHINAPAVWDYLDGAGFRCACVNMRATNFGQLHSGIVVGDAFCDIRSHHADDWGIPPGALAPLSIASILADYRVHPADLEAAHIAPFLSREPAEGNEAKVRLIAKMLAENTTAHAASTYLLAQEKLDFLAVRYPAMSQLSHDFSDPLNNPVGQGAAWKCMRLLDAFLARLIALAGTDVNVFVTGGTSAAPFWIARGPSIAHDVLWGHEASLYSVAPSLLAVFGLCADGVRGTIPPELGLTQPLKACRSVRVDGPGPEKRAIDLTASRFAGLAGAEAIQPSKGQAQMVRLHNFRTSFALAEVARLGGRYADAVADYIAALGIRAGDPGALRGVCLWLLELSRGAEARVYFTQLPSNQADESDLRMLDAQIAIQEDKLGHARSILAGLAQRADLHFGQKKRLQELSARLGADPTAASSEPILPFSYPREC